jgi:hypothetical protein
MDGENTCLGTSLSHQVKLLPPSSEQILQALEELHLRKEDSPIIIIIIIIIFFFISLCCPVARIGEALLQISLLRPDSNFVFSLAPPSFCLLFAYLVERIKVDLFVDIGRLRRTLALVVLQKRERPCALPYEHAVAKR